MRTSTCVGVMRVLQPLAANGELLVSLNALACPSCRQHACAPAPRTAALGDLHPERSTSAQYGVHSELLDVWCSGCCMHEASPCTHEARPCMHESSHAYSHAQPLVPACLGHEWRRVWKGCPHIGGCPGCGSARQRDTGASMPPQGGTGWLVEMPARCLHMHATLSHADMQLRAQPHGCCSRVLHAKPIPRAPLAALHHMTAGRAYGWPAPRDLLCCRNCRHERRQD